MLIVHLTVNREHDVEFNVAITNAYIDFKIERDSMVDVVNDVMAVVVKRDVNVV